MFSDSTDLVYVMPFKAFMRETPKNAIFKKGICKLLITNVGPPGYGDSIILGDVFFQQFKATFNAKTMKVNL
jgi:hypothetical protein